MSIATIVAETACGWASEVESATAQQLRNMARHASLFHLPFHSKFEEEDTSPAVGAEAEGDFSPPGETLVLTEGVP